MSECSFGEPRNVVAGDTVRWQLALPRFPGPSWVLSYSLRGAGQGMYLNLNETSSSEQNHLVEVAAAATAQWIPGLYKFQSYVTDEATSERQTVGWGDITIEPNLSAKDPADPRSYVRKTRDILAAAMQGRLPQGMEHYSIGGRSISKIPITQLNMLWREYEGYVQQEERGGRFREIKTRFRPVGVGASGYFGRGW